MYLNNLFYLVSVSIGSFVVGLPVLTALGKEYIPTIKGKGEAKRPRLVIGKGTGIDLSFSYDGAFGGGGLKVGQEVPFSQSLGLQFGEHKLRSGDRLCGPKQDGNYFLLKKENTIACRWPAVPTIHLPKLRAVGSMAGSMNSSSVYLPSCFFKLQEKTEAGKKSWTVVLSKCKSKPDSGRRGYYSEPLIPTATLDAEYVVE